MSPDRASTTTQPLPAATVAVVRDAPDGLEVLLQERSLDSDFVGGAWVFPGGKVDRRDALVDPSRRGRVDVDRLHAHVGNSIGPRDRATTEALLVAAVRETFEEAGVLLATRQGAPLDADDLQDEAFRVERSALADRHRDHDWRPFLRDQDLVLDLAALQPLAWWITPHGLHRRFSTRFFVAAVPEGQREPAGHDDVEMTATSWTRPAAALEAAARGERGVVYPTRQVLATLADLPDVTTAIQRGRNLDFDLRPILPIVRRRSLGLRVQHPDGGPPEPA